MKKRGFRGILAGLMAVIMLVGMIPALAAADPVYDPDKEVKIYIYVGDESSSIKSSYDEKDFADQFIPYKDGATYALKDLKDVSLTGLIGDYVSRTPEAWCIYGATVNADTGKCKSDRSITTANTLGESSLKYVGASNALLLIPEYNFTTYTNNYTPKKFYTEKSHTLKRTISSSDVEPTYQWYRYNRKVSGYDYFTLDGNCPDRYRNPAGDGWWYVDYRLDGTYKARYVFTSHSTQDQTYFPVVMDLNGKVMTAADSLDDLGTDNFYYELTCEDRGGYKSIEMYVYALTPYFYTVMGTNKYTAPVEAMANYSFHIEAVEGATEETYTPSLPGVYYCKLTYSDGSNTLSVNSEPVYADFGKFTVSFDANGGSGYMSGLTVGNQYVLPESTFTAPAGAIFKCWDVNGTEMDPGDAITISKSVTVKAVWYIPPTSYDGALDANGGTGAMANQTIADGAAAVLSENTFTKEDYKFAGWNTSADGTGTSYVDKASITSNLVALGETVKLYAQWEYVGSYTVVFDANGGAGTMASQKISRDVEVALSQNAFTNSGYAFMGWNTSADGSGTSYADKAAVKNLADADDSITLYATWEKLKTVSFDANGGAGTMMSAVADVTGAYTLPANGFTAPDGKRFKCWSVNGAEKMPGDTVTVTADTTVRALWEDIPVTYMVSFDANGGSGSMVNASGITGEYTLPANGFTAPDGKRFKCWNVNGTEKMPGDTVTIAVDTTVRALWEDVPVTYTVSFDANGGSGSMAGVSGITGVYALPENGFTAPDGKQFKCWSVNGTERAVGDIITLTEDITVSAVWTETEVSNDDWSWYAAWLLLYNSKFSVTASATEGGNVTPAGISSVQYSKDITYTITPDKGYEIKSVLVDGNDVGAVSEYTFANVQKEHTIHAVFAAVADEPATDCDGWDNCPMSAYTDLKANEWYHDALHYCLENGLMQGMGDGLFNPSGAASRAMIVTILWRIEGCPVVNYAMDFEDVAAEQWYTDTIRWAASENIVEGYGDKTFGTNDPITREQLAAILYRYEQYKGGGFKGLWMYRMDYVDLADVSDWAYEAMCWMNMNGIVEGRPGKILDPKGTASRVEAAAMIQRYCELTK